MCKDFDSCTSNLVLNLRANQIQFNPDYVSFSPYGHGFTCLPKQLSHASQDRPHMPAKIIIKISTLLVHKNRNG